MDASRPQNSRHRFGYVPSAAVPPFALIVVVALGACGLLAPAPAAAQAARPSYAVSAFTGDAYNSISPADVSVAAGVTYVTETVNTELSVYTKTGTLTRRSDWPTFFAPATNVFCVDPTIIYAARARRFALVCSDVSSQNLTTRFAVSKTADPNRGWYKWNTGPSSWVDQPSIEITKNKLVVAGSSSAGTAVWAYQLSDVLAGSTTPAVASFQIPRGQYRAAQQITPTGTGYLVQAYPQHDVYLGTITGTPATSVSFAEHDLGFDGYAPPHDAAAPGGSLGGRDLDGRALNASYEATTSGSRIIEFSQIASCGSLDCSVDGRITIGSGGAPTLSYLRRFSSSTYEQTYAAVTVDGTGRPLLAYTRSNASQAPQAAIEAVGLHRIVRNPAADVTVCRAATNPPCDERWGDYLGAAQDPVDDNRVWLAALFQTASGDDGWTSAISSVTVTR